MKRIDVNLDDPLYDRLESMAKDQGMGVEELVRKILDAKTDLSNGGDAILGMLADEPDLADAISEQAMLARERDMLRS